MIGLNSLNLEVKVCEESVELLDDLLVALAEAGLQFPLFGSRHLAPLEEEKVNCTLQLVAVETCLIASLFHESPHPSGHASPSLAIAIG